MYAKFLIILVGRIIIFFSHRKEKKFESETEEEEETAQEKRLRLAKKYLHEIEEEGTTCIWYSLCVCIWIIFNITEKDRAEFEENAVSRRLREEYLEDKGRLRKTVAINYVGHKELIPLRCKEHKGAITCICLSSDGSVLYSGSKDGSLVKCRYSHKIFEINILKRLARRTI